MGRWRSVQPTPGKAARALVPQKSNLTHKERDHHGQELFTKIKT